MREYFPLFVEALAFAWHTLLLALSLSGLMIALRHRDIGAPARRATVGFGLLTFNGVAQFVVHVLLVYVIRWRDGFEIVFIRLTIAAAVSLIFTVAGSSLVIAGLWLAFGEVRRLRDFASVPSLPADGHDGV